MAATSSRCAPPLLAVAALVWARTAAAEQPYVEVDGRSGVYQDTDATRILTEMAGAQVHPVPEISIGGRYLADLVTSASVDVVSAATAEWSETRHEALGSFAWRDADRSASATYIYSVENDWRSHTGSLGFSHDLLSHQLTLGASGAFGYNEVGRSGDANFAERLLTGTANVEAAVVASPDDLVAVTGSFLYLSGFQSSPYRFVRFESALPGATLGAPERVPDERARWALAARWNRHLVGHTFLRTQLRGYLDGWGVASGTGNVELVQGLLDVLELAVFVRGYAQKGATFYAADYPEERRYMTSDRELSSFVDGFGGVRFGFDVVDAAPFTSIRGDLKATAFAFRFFDFPALEERYGVIGELGLGASL